MKITLSRLIFAVVIIAMVLVVLVAIDATSYVATTEQTSSVKVIVTDLDDLPVHNATVSINGGASFNTDNNGNSPLIEVTNIANCYDDSITEWFCVNVVVKCNGYVPGCVFNCVVPCNGRRTVNVRLYKQDDSQLPYVCYVESPPDSYVSQLVNE